MILITTLINIGDTTVGAFYTDAELSEGYETELTVSSSDKIMVGDEILEIDGIDEIFIGLNDLSLGYGMKFMFELLSDGTVERLCKKFKSKGIPYGFGGLASLNGGLLPGHMVLKEHYRLGSSCVILSRSFCNTNKLYNLPEIKKIFTNGIGEIRAYEKSLVNFNGFEGNKNQVKSAVAEILNKIG